MIICCSGTYIISRFFCIVEDLGSLHLGRESLVCLESIVIFPVVGQYIHKLLLYVFTLAMIL